MRNTVNMTGGNSIAVRSQSISGVSAFNYLVAFYDVHRTKGEVLFILLSRTPHETIRNNYKKTEYQYIRTYHSRFLPEVVAEASQIFF
jgi:hypothetical protein